MQSLGSTRLRVAVLVLALLATVLTVRNSLAAPDRPSAAVASQANRFTENGGLATPTPPPPAFPLEPDDNAILPQPVAPDYWRFRWEGIYCAYKLYLAGPGGRSFVSPSIGPVGPPPFYFHYDYVQDAPLPADALGPWTWYVKDECAGGQSPIRTFWISGAQITATPTSVTPTTTVTPTLAEQAYLPLVVR